jgi:hypothetical protein
VAGSYCQDLVRISLEIVAGYAQRRLPTQSGECPWDRRRPSVRTRQRQADPAGTTSAIRLVICARSAR